MQARGDRMPNAMQDAQLLDLPIFSGLTAVDISGLSQRATIEEHARGTLVFRRGDEGDGLYVVLSGQVAIELSSDDGMRLLALCGPGDWFGELALVSPGPRSADARVVIDASLLRIDEDGWASLAERVPVLYARLCRRLGGHLRESNEMRRSTRRSVIACGEPGEPLPEWAFALRRSVRRQFPDREICLLDASGVEAGELPTAALRARDALQIKKAIAERRGSDCLMLIPADVDVTLADHRLSRSSATEWCLNPGRHARSSERIRGRNEADTIDRTARYIGGGVVGLALGAGGAYGFSHLGLIRALEANGVPIDCIAGTSMGAIVGAWIAAGVSAERLISWSSDAATRFYSVAIRDLNLRGPTLFAGNGFVRVLAELEETRNAAFADLQIPFVAIAMDVAAGEEVVIGSGALLEGVRASFAMPGIFPACNDMGRVLVDGASVNPVPVDRVRELGADFVVASQPIPPLQPDGEDPVKRLFGRGARLAYVLGLRARIRAVNAAMRSFQILWHRLAAMSALRADVAFAPDLRQFWFQQLGAAERIIEVGYLQALPMIPQLRATLRQRAGLVVQDPCRNG